MVSETCVPSLIVIGTVINQLETKVSLKTICCLRLFVIVIGTVINQLETKVSLKTICCMRLFVVVYKHVMF